jgi:uncharacterized protein YkwD
VTKISLLFILFAALNLAAFAQSNSSYRSVAGPSSAVWLNRARIATAPLSPSEKSLSPADLEQRVFALINELRTKSGMPRLTWSDEVAKVARTHSSSMAEQKFFSHRGLDGSMVDDRADRFGLSEWREIGENIAFTSGVDKPADFAVEKWMESPSHRQNLLNKMWTESGIGIAIAADGTVYFTQVFLLRK